MAYSNGFYMITASVMKGWRIHLRVCSLWAFLFQRHFVFHPSWRFLKESSLFPSYNSIYKKEISFIPLRGNSSRFSAGCVCVCVCVSNFVFARSLGSITFLLLNVTHFFFSSLIMHIINNYMLRNFNPLVSGVH